MVHVRPLSALCGLLAFCSFAVPRANADDFTVTGSLPTDNDIAKIPIVTTTPQDYTFYTTSYNGGTNADGSTTGAGGFDPVLSLFNADGTLFSGIGTPVSLGGSDADISDVLGPGSYTLVVSEFPNFSTDNNINGYAGIGDLVTESCGPSPAFTDPITCTTLDGKYTVNVVSSAVTPEPPSAVLLLLPLGGLVYFNRRRLSQLSAL